MAESLLKLSLIMPHKIGHNAEDVLVKYMNEEVLGKSPNTIKAKVNDLKKFSAFLDRTLGSISYREWTPGITRLFREELKRQGYAPSSINRNLATVRSFGDWLLELGLVKGNPCKGVKDYSLPPLRPKAPRDKEFFRLRRAANQLAHSRATAASQDFRNSVLLEVLAASGLRISELLNVKLLQFDGKSFSSVLCKGQKIRNVSIKSEAARLLSDYIENYRVKGCDFIFTTKSGNQLDRRNANRALKKIASFASSKLDSDQKIEISPHQLRHRHAYKCREAKDPVFAAKRLGHSTLNYIDRYSMPSESEESDLLESID